MNPSPDGRSRVAPSVRPLFRRSLCVCALFLLLTLAGGLRAQLPSDPSQLTDEQKAELLRRLEATSPKTGEDSSYKSPDYFLTNPDTSRPAARPTSEPAQPKPGELPTFESLRAFGSHLFSQLESEPPPDNIASDDTYVLGAGDQVIIYLWGRVDQEYSLTVDREGKIVIPKVGEVMAWGKSFADLKKELKRRLASAYSEFELSISLGKIRSIRIFLAGEVTRPGAYTVSSLTSIFNALYLAGGPNDHGSMRSVRLIRQGEEILNKDLYDFLLKGDNSFDVRLESGDVVFVPVAGRRVAIRGEVIRPAVYEVLEGQSPRDLLHLAGGPTSRAHLSRIQLERVTADREWQVFDLNLSPEAPPDTLSARPLQDGDRVTVYSVFGGRKNRVAIFGKVKYPGYYERSDTTRLSHLLRQSQLQEYDVYLDRANLFRRHTDWSSELIHFSPRLLLSDPAADVPLQDLDSVYIYSLQETQWLKQVFIQGEVARPGTYAFHEGMTVGDLILLAGSYSRSAYRLRGEISHFDSVGQVSVSPLDLLDSAQLSVVLHEDDRVYIRQVPEWQYHPTVTILGEVQFPGEYALIHRQETLLGLIERAGGFTTEAFPRGTVFLRPTISARLDRLKLRSQLEKSTPLILDTLGQPLKLSFVEFESGSVNRIAIDVERLRKSEGKEGDLVLQPNDSVIVPAIPSGISVLGAVGINATIQFREDESVKYYIERAGGFTRRADEDGTRLIRANGMAYSGGGTMGQTVDLGDVIAVPTKIEREGHFTRDLVMILTVATASLTAIILVSKI